MQSPEARLYKTGLALALRRYSAAVSDMEQTVLLPSLLRDVPSDEQWDCEEPCRDLYGNYLMLKAIRNTMENGLMSHENSKVVDSLGQELEMELDAEGLFHFHLRGLFSVMKDLTTKTKSLTEKYMDIIGVAN